MYILKDAWPVENDSDGYMIVANLIKSSPASGTILRVFVCLLIFAAILKLEDDYSTTAELRKLIPRES